MMDCAELLAKVPEEWYEIKDCWMVACKMVALQNGKDGSLLDLNAYFYYNREDAEKYPDGFEGIVRKNISIAEDRETKKEIEQEYDFLHQFIGLYCSGMSCSGEKAFKYAYSHVEKGASCILWIDTFYAEWNGMYQQVHFPHCVTIMKMDPEKCVIFDAFQKENPCFEVETERLFAMTNFVNIFEEDRNYNEFKNANEVMDVFVKNFIVKYKSIDDYIGVLENVSEDMEKIKNNLDVELDNENTIKLTMRIFVNQYQKGTAQLACFKQATSITGEMLQLCEDINNLWRLCASVFAKIAYLSSEKRRQKYDLLCSSVKEIRSKLITFDELMHREVVFER